ncbi:hypothetical protein BASA50_003783 [Batrachochytrium salamandrivorans]|uniref:C2H2-type domain-containing protein n=1 Tax=Batrachochytrium salamandrivorans TaxID=1357716 RepID=A0ABQ8FHN4_9FUNG|nr:hypothetical protein BASA60_005570 [Batrachochytrium salamandrivorans]KAH6574883.1 hypothetical protein BASA62_002248 [Batrachochytrium salamandrivorans]KAH6598362.1 hypothetical protein BASA50_003783 [Batrachochytrium salamandrivorans]KAH9271733.1 hypothetical protein BASA83_006103 [Batrachochytrium salamandrivorans]
MEIKECGQGGPHTHTSEPSRLATWVTSSSNSSHEHHSLIHPLQEQQQQQQTQPQVQQLHQAQVSSQRNVSDVSSQPQIQPSLQEWTAKLTMEQRSYHASLAHSGQKQQQSKAFQSTAPDLPWHYTRELGINLRREVDIPLSVHSKPHPDQPLPFQKSLYPMQPHSHSYSKYSPVVNTQSLSVTQSCPSRPTCPRVELVGNQLPQIQTQQPQKALTEPHMQPHDQVSTYSQKSTRGCAGDSDRHQPQHHNQEQQQVSKEQHHYTLRQLAFMNPTKSQHSGLHSTGAVSSSEAATIAPPPQQQQEQEQQRRVPPLYLPHYDSHPASHPQYYQPTLPLCSPYGERDDAHVQQQRGKHRPILPLPFSYQQHENSYDVERKTESELVPKQGSLSALQDTVIGQTQQTQLETPRCDSDRTSDSVTETTIHTGCGYSNTPRVAVEQERSLVLAAVRSSPSHGELSTTATSNRESSISISSISSIRDNGISDIEARADNQQRCSQSHHRDHQKEASEYGSRTLPQPQGASDSTRQLPSLAELVLPIPIKPYSSGKNKTEQSQRMYGLPSDTVVSDANEYLGWAESSVGRIRTPSSSPGTQEHILLMLNTPTVDNVAKVELAASPVGADGGSISGEEKELEEQEQEQEQLLQSGSRPCSSELTAFVPANMRESEPDARIAVLKRTQDVEVDAAHASFLGRIYKDQDTRRYQCQYCAKRFSRPSSLTTHIYTHTGERPFACDIPGCGRSFSVLSNLRRHTRVCQRTRERRLAALSGLALRQNDSYQAWRSAPNDAAPAYMVDLAGRGRGGSEGRMHLHGEQHRMGYSDYSPQHSDLPYRGVSPSTGPVPYYGYAASPLAPMRPPDMHSSTSAYPHTASYAPLNSQYEHHARPPIPLSDRRRFAHVYPSGSASHQPLHHGHQMSGVAPLRDTHLQYYDAPTPIYASTSSRTYTAAPTYDHRPLNHSRSQIRASPPPSVEHLSCQEHTYPPTDHPGPVKSQLSLDSGIGESLPSLAYTGRDGHQIPKGSDSSRPRTSLPFNMPASHPGVVRPADLHYGHTDVKRDDDVTCKLHRCTPYPLKQGVITGE